MNSSYENQIFISYAREQRDKVSRFIDSFRRSGIEVWWDNDIQVGTSWSDKIEDKIKNSRHFLLYCNVQAKASEMVNKEVLIFKKDSKDDPSRKIFVLRAPDCEDKHIPFDLQKVQYPSTLGDIISFILREERDELKQNLRELEKKSQREKEELENHLTKERVKVAEARKYYLHRRFWGPFAENRDVHIFTCGRDIHPDKTNPRGTGGYRTNIDKWDYRAVLGIAHYFASTYPGTKLTIEDPASKLQQADIDKTHVLANRIAEIGNLLKDKDCIIIGSPDVSDFAEVILSRIHGILPYDNERKKSTGFVLVRNKKNTSSSFYWNTEKGETEGIARLGGGKITIFPYDPAPLEVNSQKAGTMHGILVVSENPFSDSEPKKRVMILSGFSGVATDAMVRFLTEEAYLPSFFTYDELQSQQSSATEALISVKYIEGSGSENKDARQIHESSDSIFFQELLPVGRPDLDVQRTITGQW